MGRANNLMSTELSYGLLKNFILNVIQWKVFKKYPIRPLFFTHYLTLKCNFQCQYCGFARHSKETTNGTELDTKDTLELLKIIRKESACIYFTGGEPLLRGDIVKILGEARKMKFRLVAVNTNMSLIDKKPEVLNHVTSLIASLDVIENKKNAKLLCVSKKIVEKVKENILDCASLQKKKDFTLTVNCVVTPETVSDVREVMDFCFSNGIRLAVVPAELDGGEPDPMLKSNPEYRKLIKDIIEAKKQGMPVFGPLNYLNTIYDFKSFACFPLLTPHTYPNGDLFYPCQPSLKVAGNLLFIGSYKKALEIGSKKHGKFLGCGNKCHKACYIQPSTFLEHPTSVFKEFS
jgi:MoaA/NifB/PqqE/SkfB family radical SAM enzyme